MFHISCLLLKSVWCTPWAMTDPAIIFLLRLAVIGKPVTRGKLPPVLTGPQDYARKLCCKNGYATYENSMWGITPAGRAWLEEEDYI